MSTTSASSTSSWGCCCSPAVPRHRFWGRSASRLRTFADGYQLAFVIAGICVLVGILVAALVLRTPRAPKPELAIEPD